MNTPIAVQMTPQWLMIPRSVVQDWREIEVVRQEQCIVIRPKSLPTTQAREAAIEALRQDGLLAEMPAAPLTPPVTLAERAALAKKLSVGRPLSEIVREEREAGW